MFVAKLTLVQVYLVWEEIEYALLISFIRSWEVTVRAVKTGKIL